MYYKKLSLCIVSVKIVLYDVSNVNKKGLK